MQSAQFDIHSHSFSLFLKEEGLNFSSTTLLRNENLCVFSPGILAISSDTVNNPTRLEYDWSGVDTRGRSWKFYNCMLTAYKLLKERDATMPSPNVNVFFVGMDYNTNDAKDDREHGPALGKIYRWLQGIFPDGTKYSKSMDWWEK